MATNTNLVNFLKSGNIDLNTSVGRMYFCFAEDEYPVIKEEHPDFNKEQLQKECLVRWYKLVADHERYIKYLEISNA